MNNIQNTEFDWAVIGAGPAGIAAVGKLIDHQVDPKKLSGLTLNFASEILV